MGRRKVRKERKLSPPANQEIIAVDRSRHKWELDVSNRKIPYASHIPKNPSQMSEERKQRIRRVVWWLNKGLNPAQIADKMKIDRRVVKRDLSAAVVLTQQNLPYVPKLEREIMTGMKTYTEKTRDLMDRVEKIVNEIEEGKMYLDPKGAMSMSMMLGELRQTLELGAKLTGELQTGTRINVIQFSGMIKRLIEIISQEVDKTTFLRIRERLKLEIQGQEPLGPKGGEVELPEEIAEAQEVEEVNV